MNPFCFVQPYPSLCIAQRKRLCRNSPVRYIQKLHRVRMCTPGKNEHSSLDSEISKSSTPDPVSVTSTDALQEQTAGGGDKAPFNNNHDDIGGGKGNRGDKGDEGDSGQEGGSSLPPSLAAVLEPLRNASKAVGRSTARVGQAFDFIPQKIGDAVQAILRIVPAQVLVALISVLSTLGGTHMRNKTDQRAKERLRQEKIEQDRAKIEAELRRNYQKLSLCLLKASFKLAERLTSIAEYGLVDGSEEDELDSGTGFSSTYSAYLLARYLAAVELLKKRSATLDLGFPAADRIFLNLLGRVQGVLAADERMVLHMQQKERLFKPAFGEDPVPGGPLRVMPRAQLCLGEILLKQYWKKEPSMNNDELDEPSMNSILSYVEFRDLLKREKSLQQWFNPVLASFRKLQQEKTTADSRRFNNVNAAAGARVYLLQCALMDLVDFLDPGPKPRYVPMYKRRRLRLGGNSFSEEPEMPESLLVLYKQLGTLRDNRQRTTSFPRQDTVEVFIKSPEGCCELFTEPGENGDCPFSQRVLIVLEEMGIPYHSVNIDANSKPAWYHLVHPRNQTPVVYHEGQLLVESRQIVSYLIDRFPEKRQLAGAGHLKLRFGSAKFRRFHPAFVEWICGREEAKNEFESELRSLNEVLKTIQCANGGGPFFGGERFSREDTALAPFLHHVTVAGKEILNWELPSDCSKIQEYLSAAREEESFSKTVAGKSSIVEGYRKLKMSGRARDLVLFDSLE